MMAADAKNVIESYRENFSQVAGSLAGGGSAWVKKLREEAIARFVELGFPTRKMEQWRHLDISRITDSGFRFDPQPEVNGEVKDGVEGRLLQVLNSHRIVLVNGVFEPKLSHLPKSGPVAVTSLRAVLESDPDRLRPHLGAAVDWRNRAFAALNTAFLHDGAAVFLPKGCDAGVPIHVIYVSSSRREQTVVHPRILVAAQENSKATVVEEYIGPREGGVFCNAVVEFALGPHASVRHFRLERESEGACHVGCVGARQQRGSSFRSHSVLLGGALVRNDIDVVMEGEGAECMLNGLYLARGEQKVDHHTTIDHAAPHCTSRELFKGVLGDKSRAVFHGRVVVRPGAQKTDAEQSNRNLLLSEGALVQSNPQLEIFADDVKCRHGSSIGQLDENAMFYLRSRGIGREAARNILIHAFAQEMVDRVKVESLRWGLRRELSDRFSREIA